MSAGPREPKSNESQSSSKEHVLGGECWCNPQVIHVEGRRTRRCVKPLAWTYTGWDGKHLFIGGDERYRRTVLVRLPFSTRAVVFAISRPGVLYDPDDFRDTTFERWQRVYR